MRMQRTRCSKRSVSKLFKVLQNWGHMSIEKLPDQSQSTNTIKIIRCLNCGNERQITDQWLKEISSKLSSDESIIDESEITRYLNRLYCSKCKEKNFLTYTAKQSVQNQETIEMNHSTANIGEHDPKRFNQAALETKRNIDRECYLDALERKKERDKQSGGIPEYEEGVLRAEFGTREDYKRMRGSDFGDMMKRRNE